MQNMGPIQLAFELLKSSLKQLKGMKRFLFLPAICSLLDLLILGLILSPLHRLESVQQPLSKIQWEHFAVFFALYLIFLYLTHLIFFFSHTTLLQAMNLQLSGGTVTLRKALRKTVSIYYRIILWVSFASTLGFFWSLFRKKDLGKQSFGIASYFVLPILIENNIHTIEALRRSSELMTATWGPNLRPRFVNMAIIIPALFVCFIPFFLALAFGGHFLVIFSLGLSLLLIFIFSIFYISARTALLWNLYQFARERNASERAPGLFESAFVTREFNESK